MDIKEHIGEIHTAKELKEILGYKPTTYICDTMHYQRGWFRQVKRSDGKMLPYLYEIIPGNKI